MQTARAAVNCGGRVMSVLTNPHATDHVGEHSAQGETCPYLKRAVLTSRYPIEGYCVAHPHGRLRVVTIAEFRESCTTGAYVQCQLYRELRHQARAEEGPERDTA